jgi:ribosome biogenesis protein BMS1
MAPADGGGGGGVEQPRKAHRVAKSGAKARKRKGKGAAGDDEGGDRKNPKVRTLQPAALIGFYLVRHGLSPRFGLVSVD